MTKPGLFFVLILCFGVFCYGRMFDLVVLDYRFSVLSPGIG